MQLVEFDDLDELVQHLDRGGSLVGAVIQGLDVTGLAGRLDRADLSGSVFLGGRLAPSTYEHACSSGGVVFRPPSDVPFEPYRSRLYDADELFAGFDPGQAGSYEGTPDEVIYRYCQTQPGTVLDSLAMRLHDHAITDALDEFIRGHRVVAIMGGHGLARTSDGFRSVIDIAKPLAERGYLLATGGGPGAMEAAHLGAWLAHRDDSDVDTALHLLSAAPTYADRHGWLTSALAVKKRLPRREGPRGRVDSLGIPTWLYGHEPPTVFATHIAKYFANSVREEGLLAIAQNGVVFTPGSAGTIQEVFQDATQNHYRSFGAPAPMVFFGRDYWTIDKPVFPLLRHLAGGHDYADLLAITDSASEVVAVLEQFHRFRSQNGVAREH